MKYPHEIFTLINFLKKFSGVGTKTAERFVFQLLSWPQDELKKFSQEISYIKEKIHHCEECGCLKTDRPCELCDTHKRDSRYLCIISSPKDVYAIEETQTYKGLYHVTGGLLSPLEGRSLDQMLSSNLIKRIDRFKVEEVIIALDSTLEGDATALYLKQQLQHLKITLSRLAFGIPIGSSLEYVDGGTLMRALAGRQVF